MTEKSGWVGNVTLTTSQRVLVGQALVREFNDEYQFLVNNHEYMSRHESLSYTVRKLFRLAHTLVSVGYWYEYDLKTVRQNIVLVVGEAERVAYEESVVRVAYGQFDPNDDYNLSTGYTVRMVPDYTGNESAEANPRA